MSEKTSIVRIGARPVEVTIGDEVQIAADLPGVWLRVLRIGPTQTADNNPAVFLLAPGGNEFRTTAGAIVAIRHARSRRSPDNRNLPSRE